MKAIRKLASLLPKSIRTTPHMQPAAPTASNEVHPRTYSMVLYTGIMEDSLRDISISELYEMERAAAFPAPWVSSERMDDAWFQNLKFSAHMDPMEPERLDDYDINMLPSTPAASDRRIYAELQEALQTAASDSKSTSTATSTTHNSSFNSMDGDGFCQVRINAIASRQPKDGSSASSELSSAAPLPAEEYQWEEDEVMLRIPSVITAALVPAKAPAIRSSIISKTSTNKKSPAAPAARGQGHIACTRAGQAKLGSVQPSKSRNLKQSDGAVPMPGCSRKATAKQIVRRWR